MTKNPKSVEKKSKNPPKNNKIKKALEIIFEGDIMSIKSPKLFFGQRDIFDDRSLPEKNFQD